MARSSAAFTVSGNSVTFAAIVSFPAMASGSGGVITFFGLGPTSSGASELDFFGSVSPTIAVVNGVTPKLDTTTSVSNATSDGMTNAAATAFLTLFFNNTAWANIGNAGGLLPSSVAGSLYCSLHTSTPAESGFQNTNEISYS